MYRRTNSLTDCIFSYSLNFCKYEQFSDPVAVISESLILDRADSLDVRCSMFDFPDAAGRAPDKQFCFSPEGADSPYETYFPIACTTVPCLQPIGLAMVD